MIERHLNGEKNPRRSIAGSGFNTIYKSDSKSDFGSMKIRDEPKPNSNPYSPQNNAMQREISKEDLDKEQRFKDFDSSINRRMAAIKARDPSLKVKKIGVDDLNDRDEVVYQQDAEQ